MEKYNPQKKDLAPEQNSGQDKEKVAYNPQRIEKKWQRKWERLGIFRAEDFSKKPKFYCLDMFPYPSAQGVHVGHLRGYSFSDLISKKKMMEGFNILHPMGWDAFGLPAENFAIKTSIHPAISTKKAISNIKRQLISAGFSYDWSREICSCQPDYYKWTQWMFLRFYKAGLAYRKEAAVNFCPSCKTVLANEQVINGRCERCGTLVEKKYLKQWFFKITDYAEKLLLGLDNPPHLTRTKRYRGKIDWPEKIKVMQKEWIGKSEGINIDFPIKNKNYKLRIFTKFPETIFGVTFMVVAPEHKIISKFKSEILNYKEVENYVYESQRKSELERTDLAKEKTGVELKGINAINPVNNEEVPVFVGDFVLSSVGTGAVMAVPGHDVRDFEFAQKLKLPIKRVIRSYNGDDSKIDKIEKVIEDGIVINSQFLNNLDAQKQARERIKDYLEEKKIGQKTIVYKLRDWLVSRQRYWGAPIPIIYCQKCGEVPVPEKDLPLRLPKIKDFKPTGKGESPLAKSEKFVKAKCPKCGSQAKRETDTLDTFVCSSWYFLRYTDPKNKKGFASKSKIKRWLPVDLYIGGAEHAVMHLLYARFFAKFLFDQKLIDFNEPFLKLFNQGIVYRQGAKMSKSKGNVVTPDYIIQKFGADTMRLYELFMGPAVEATEWSDAGVIGCWRFLQKVWRLFEKLQIPNPKPQIPKENEFPTGQVNSKGARQGGRVAGELESKIPNSKLEKLIHKTIKKVTEDIENFRFNTAVSALMVLTAEFEKQKQLSITDYHILLKLLAPMAPHVCEELYQRTVNSKQRTRVKSIFQEKWPKYDPKIVKEKNFTLIIQINGKIRDKIEIENNISQAEVERLTFEREKVKKWVKDKKIKRIVFVKNKLINIVVNLKS